VGSNRAEYWLIDHAPQRSTWLNDALIRAPEKLNHGDQIRIGGRLLLRVELIDPAAETTAAETAATGAAVPGSWSTASWKDKPSKQIPTYPNLHELDQSIAQLKRMPPLVTSWEVEALKEAIADAQLGNRFFLQGGDCAETLEDCTPSLITAKLKILFQMSLVLVHGARKPVIRVGRFAGQYAKPRSSATERRGDLELPSYMGDLVNRPEFTPEARRPNPELLVRCYQHAALTLNFIRALGTGGFADLRRAEHLDVSIFDHAKLPEYLKNEYRSMSREIADSLRFVRSLGDAASAELTRAAFFSSHEGLNLHYESAQTRTVPHRSGYYDLSTHMPWIGERTREISGAHVEFFRGIANPVGVKIGPTAVPQEIIALCKRLNPDNAAGKLVLITRMGAANVRATLPALLAEVQAAGVRVLWVCDPMHGNGTTTKSGLKTRDFVQILDELEATFDVHDACGSVFGGVHFELTGEDVTECLGAGTSEADLDTRYLTACDPRLNYRQSMELAFCISRRMQSAPSVQRPTTMPPARNR
jgi:3-deoxy-7-phosphoheptulonate synthase